MHFVALFIVFSRMIKGVSAASVIHRRELLKLLRENKWMCNGVGLIDHACQCDGRLRSWS